MTLCMYVYVCTMYVCACMCVCVCVYCAHVYMCVHACVCVCDCMYMTIHIYYVAHVCIITQEPPPKRSRKMPCDCSMCKDTFRDHRTVQRHQAAETAKTSKNLNENVYDLDINPGNASTPSSHNNDECEDDLLLDEDNLLEQEDEPFAIPSNRITNYVLGELRTKLTLLTVSTRRTSCKHKSTNWNFTTSS